MLSQDLELRALPADPFGIKGLERVHRAMKRKMGAMTLHQDAARTWGMLQNGLPAGCSLRTIQRSEGSQGGRVAVARTLGWRRRVLAVRRAMG